MLIMRTKIFIISLLLVLCLNFAVMAAKYAGEAFMLGVGARSLALGGATIAGGFDGTAPYWNPAGMNQLEGKQLTAMHVLGTGTLPKTAPFVKTAG